MADSRRKSSRLTTRQTDLHPKSHDYRTDPVPDSRRRPTSGYRVFSTVDTRHACNARPYRRVIASWSAAATGRPSLVMRVAGLEKALIDN